MGGSAPTSDTQRSLGGAAFYNIYQTLDGEYVVLGAREMKICKDAAHRSGT